ncbi:MAG: hypothetical protein ACKVU4_04615 [Phycisphaerales bacterium]
MADGPASPPRGVVSANNRLGLDYRAEARRLGPPVTPIIDAHAHIAGATAAGIYDDARRVFGVTRTYTMTQLPQAAAVRDALGDSVRFIAFPTWSGADRARTHRDDYIGVIESFRRDFDARILKLWAAPRLRDLVPDGRDDLWSIDSPWRRRACEVGRSLGMMFMVHVADPDIYFRTRYADTAKYGTKRDQYVGLERMLDEFEGPWIAAHMGGWPEDLGFLAEMLARHPNLYLDCSATKWVVRELSRQPSDRVRAFFIRWKGRILFGSDIVTTDDHTRPGKERPDHPKADQANSPAAAFDLYASRYWALRMLLETGYNGPSPIADPDLKLEDPPRYNDDSAPEIRGLSLPRPVLESLYQGTVTTVIQH